jgi:hypothetical protein
MVLAARTLLLTHDQWQSILGIANYDYFCVGTLGKSFRGFNAFPLQQLRADSLGNDLLEVVNAR